ncbi:MAG: hypothetical protein JOZ31_03815 [Verrucomicrobia bacterium]|nr:hypothetical protein [Verrucomicrobiota bacterium]MBV8484842.1 hypothetical protein [Verrucomicrobiota bacterium]
MSSRLLPQMRHYVAAKIYKRASFKIEGAPKLSEGGQLIWLFGWEMLHPRRAGAHPYRWTHASRFA